MSNLLNKSILSSEEKMKKFVFSKVQDEVTKFKKGGFTLAEVLITLSVIGVVAALTIPAMMQSMKGVQFPSANKKMTATIKNGFGTMIANEEMTGYQNTEDFVKGMQKYFKIAFTCDKDNLKSCFAEKFINGDTEIDLAKIKTAENLGKENWGTNVNGVYFQDGTNALIAYNPNCSTANAGSNDAIINNCVSIVYDLDGSEKTNVLKGNGESDLGLYNASINSGPDCGELVWSDCSTCTSLGYECDTYGCVHYNGKDAKTEACYINNGIEGSFINLEDSDIQAKVVNFCKAHGSAGWTYHRIHKYSIECNCFAKGSMITLADGTTKTIEDLSFDDEILVWNFDEGKMDSAKALWIMQPKVAAQYNLLTFSDGTILKTIGQHRIFNKELGKYTYPMTEETPIGTTTLLANGSEVQLIDKKVVFEEVEYYNVITENHFNVFANGISTSNRFNNLYPIKDYKFVKDDRELVSYEEYKDIPYEWYEKLRLAEQPRQINRGNDDIHDNSVVEYVQRLIASNKRPVIVTTDNRELLSV